MVQTLPSSVQAVPFAFFASAGQAAEVPVQFSATSHPSPAAARHTVDDGAKPSVGQLSDEPLQVSATSQTPARPRDRPSRSTSGLHVPTKPAELQAPQPLLQALLQQTPLTQKPLAHWLFVVQPRPPEQSWKRAPC